MMRTSKGLRQTYIVWSEKHSMHARSFILTWHHMWTRHMASWPFWENLSFYFTATRLTGQRSCTLFLCSHYHSAGSMECIGYTWRSNLFQGSYKEVKLVLRMNKQPSQTRAPMHLPRSHFCFIPLMQFSPSIKKNFVQSLGLPKCGAHSGPSSVHVPSVPLFFPVARSTHHRRW